MALGRHEAVAAEPRRIDGKRLEMSPPDRQARYMTQIFPRRGGLGESKFRILFGILGEAMMSKVKIAEPVGGQSQGEAREAGNALIEPGAAERRLMDRLVQQGEQEGDQYALRDHEQGPERYL